MMTQTVTDKNKDLNEIINFTNKARKKVTPKLFKNVSMTQFYRS